MTTHVCGVCGHAETGPNNGLLPKWTMPRTAVSERELRDPRFMVTGVVIAICSAACHQRYVEALPEGRQHSRPGLQRSGGRRQHGGEATEGR